MTFPERFRASLFYKLAYVKFNISSSVNRRRADVFAEYLREVH
jgi:hypothetical protein